MNWKGYLALGVGLISTSAFFLSERYKGQSAGPLPRSEQAVEIELNSSELNDLRKPPEAVKQLCVVDGYEHLAEFRYPTGERFYDALGEVAKYIDNQTRDLFENPDYSEKRGDRKYIVKEGIDDYHFMGPVLPAVVAMENGGIDSRLRDPMQVFRDACKDDLSKEDNHHFIPELVREMAIKAANDTKGLTDYEAGRISVYTGAGCLLHKALIYDDYDPVTDTVVIVGMDPLPKALNDYNGHGYDKYSKDDETYADRVLEKLDACRPLNADSVNLTSLPKKSPF